LFLNWVAFNPGPINTRLIDATSYDALSLAESLVAVAIRTSRFQGKKPELASQQNERRKSSRSKEETKGQPCLQNS